MKMQTQSLFRIVDSQNAVKKGLSSVAVQGMTSSSALFIATHFANLWTQDEVFQHALLILILKELHGSS